MGGIGLPELIILLVMFVPGIIGAVMAKNKGRNAFLWFFLCVFFWIPVLIILFLPPAKEVPGKIKECPSCKEFIKWDALVCKHCHTELSQK